MQIVPKTQTEEQINDLMNQLSGLTYDENGNAIDRVTEARIISELEALGVEL